MRNNRKYKLNEEATEKLADLTRQNGGSIMNRGGDTYMVKKIDKSGDGLQFKRAEIANEYISGALYRTILGSQAPKIKLISSKKDTDISIGSKFLKNFQTLDTFSGGEPSLVGNNEKIQSTKIEGLERVFAACLLLGEADMHAGNIGVTRSEGKKGKETFTAAKIDHGFSLTSFSTPNEKIGGVSSALYMMVKNLHMSNYQNINNFDLGKLRDEIDKVTDQLTDKKIEKIANSKVKDLQKQNLSVQKGLVIEVDGVKIPSKQLRNYELSDYKELLVNNLKQQREALRELSKELEPHIEVAKEKGFSEWLVETRNKTLEKSEQDRKALRVAKSEKEKAQEVSNTIDKDSTVSVSQPKSQPEVSDKDGTVKINAEVKSKDTGKETRQQDDKNKDLSNNTGVNINQTKKEEQKRRSLEMSESDINVGIPTEDKKNALNQCLNNQYWYKEGDIGLIGSQLFKEVEGAKFLGVCDPNNEGYKSQIENALNEGQRAIGAFNVGNHWVAFMATRDGNDNLHVFVKDSLGQERGDVENFLNGLGEKVHYHHQVGKIEQKEIPLVHCGLFALENAQRLSNLSNIELNDFNNVRFFTPNEKDYDVTFEDLRKNYAVKYVQGQYEELATTMLESSKRSAFLEQYRNENKPLLEEMQNKVNNKLNEVLRKDDYSLLGTDQRIRVGIFAARSIFSIDAVCIDPDREIYGIKLGYDEGKLTNRVQAILSNNGQSINQENVDHLKEQLKNEAMNCFNVCVQEITDRPILPRANEAHVYIPENELKKTLRDHLTPSSNMIVNQDLGPERLNNINEHLLEQLHLDQVKNNKKEEIIDLVSREVTLDDGIKKKISDELARTEDKQYDRSSKEDINLLSNNLKRAEKSTLAKIQNTEEVGDQVQYNLNKHLIEVNADKNNITQVLDSLNKNSHAQIETDSKQSNKLLHTKQITGRNGEVTILPESNHLVEHKNNIAALITNIQSGQILPNTVIALERKQYGDNLGMADVIKLANIISHNEKHPHDKITIPKEINSSLIYQDAMLYKTAQENGITIIGIEGKGLDTHKSSPDYDAKREEHMSKVLEEVTKSGHNVILSLGSDHVADLKTSLDNKGLKTQIVQDVSKMEYSKEQQRESKSTKFTDKIKQQNQQDTKVLQR